MEIGSQWQRLLRNLQASLSYRKCSITGQCPSFREGPASALCQWQVNLLLHWCLLPTRESKSLSNLLVPPYRMASRKRREIIHECLHHEALSLRWPQRKHTVSSWLAWNQCASSMTWHSKTYWFNEAVWHVDSKRGQCPFVQFSLKYLSNLILCHYNILIAGFELNKCSCPSVIGLTDLKGIDKYFVMRYSFNSCERCGMDK